MDTTDNYFKVTTLTPLGKAKDTLFFFTGQSLRSTLTAYRNAVELNKELNGDLSVFSPPRKHRGQWDKEAAVVGHRHYDAIMDDILASVAAEDTEANALLTDEMNSLQARWRSISH